MYSLYGSMGARINRSALSRLCVDAKSFQCVHGGERRRELKGTMNAICLTSPDLSVFLKKGKGSKIPLWHKT